MRVQSALLPLLLAPLPALLFAMVVVTLFGPTIVTVTLAIGIVSWTGTARLVRVRTTEGDKQYGVRVSDLIKRGDVSANVEMKPGDVLIIPRSWF